MFGLLEQLLCWIKQLGVMVLGALIAGLNLIIVGIAEIAQAAIDAMPGMPDLPEAPPLMIEAWGWVLWTPLPVVAGAAMLSFYFGAAAIWSGIAIALRWAKVID